MGQHPTKICVVGIGYIGLPTAAIFAQTGFDVLGYDVNSSVVDALNQGQITIEEPQLGDIVAQVVASGKLRASTTIEPADAFFIAVPTPVNVDNSADLSYIEQACQTVLKVLKAGDIVVLESTSPPGTTDDVVVKILEKSGLIIGSDIFVAHTPERVIPGRILEELVHNSRIIGGINDASSQAVAALFATFVKGKIIETDAKTAEMCKVMENTYRDINIALANEMAKICEQMGISAWQVREYANYHPRVNILMPGPGVGGHCIAVDPWFLVEKNPQLAQLIAKGRHINDSMPSHTYQLINKHIQPGSTLVILGVTFKPNVDDMRESPILELIEMLKQNGYQVVIHDPHVKAYCNDLYQVAQGADGVVLAVNHDDFNAVDFDKLHQALKGHVMIDTRNMWTDQLSGDLRFKHIVLGRG